MKYRLRHETYETKGERWYAEKEVDGGWVEISDPCVRRSEALEWIRANRMCSEQPVSVEYEDV